MFNPKHIVIAAIVGFVLSFLIGIFSGIAFLLVLLRALICALIFGAVGAGASILFQKFLSVEQSDTVSDASVEKAPRVGGIVDYTVGDDSLPEDEQGPRFDVSGTRSALRSGVKPNQSAAFMEQPSDRQPAATVSAEFSQRPVATPKSASPNVASAGFTPVNLADATKAAPAQGGAEPVSASGGLIDELPDIGGISFGDEKKDAGEEDDEVVDDSDFAREDAPAPVRTATFSSGKSVADQNASVMAQAIRTILTKN